MKCDASSVCRGLCWDTLQAPVRTKQGRCCGRTPSEHWRGTLEQGYIELATSGMCPVFTHVELGQAPISFQWPPEREIVVRKRVKVQIGIRFVGLLQVLRVPPTVKKQSNFVGWRLLIASDLWVCTCVSCGRLMPYLECIPASHPVTDLVWGHQISAPYTQVRKQM